MSTQIDFPDDAPGHAELAGAFAVLARELEELNRIGAALSEERDVGALLDLILTKARQITASDAGSLYVVQPDRAGLRFVVQRQSRPGRTRWCRAS